MIQILLVDQEYKSLIPPLDPVEYDQLEENILKDGVRDHIIHWAGTIVDGHNRYEICQKHDLTYPKREMVFESRDAAKEWIIKNQLGRRNLPEIQRARLALKLKPVLEAKAKERQGMRSDLTFVSCDTKGPLMEQNNFSQKSDKCHEVNEKKHPDTLRTMADIAGVSRDTMSKVVHIEEKAPEPIREAARSNTISINKAYQLSRESLRSEDPEREAREKIYREETAKDDRDLRRARKIYDSLTGPLHIDPTEDDMRLVLEKIQSISPGEFVLYLESAEEKIQLAKKILRNMKTLKAVK